VFDALTFMPLTIEVLKPGLFTTVQDLGRFGYQKFGVSVSGAMDFFSHRVANLLVGNDDTAATLECTILGPTLRFLADVTITVTGADLSPRLDGVAMGMWRTHSARKGSELSFGPCRQGCRAYLSIGGGFDVPAVLGSRSTHVRTRLGGLEGRALRKGDILSCFQACATVSPRVFRSAFADRFLSARTIRFLRGPQADRVEPESLEMFERHKYRVSTHSDRMGIRFEGSPLSHRGSADIISDALPYGTIQLPANGLPIILAADRQTTGGYPKIGIVISADFPALGQLKPGDEIEFRCVSYEESVRELQAVEVAISSMTAD